MRDAVEGAILGRDRDIAVAVLHGRSFAEAAGLVGDGFIAVTRLTRHRIQTETRLGHAGLVVVASLQSISVETDTGLVADDEVAIADLQHILADTSTRLGHAGLIAIATLADIRFDADTSLAADDQVAITLLDSIGADHEAILDDFVSIAIAGLGTGADQQRAALNDIGIVAIAILTDQRPGIAGLDSLSRVVVTGLIDRRRALGEGRAGAENSKSNSTSDDDGFELHFERAFN